MFAYYKNGPVVKADDKQFVVDDSKVLQGTSAAFITHAHSDHLKVSKTAPFTYYMSQGTFDLGGFEFENAKAFSKKLNFDGVSVEQFSAGHILGSNQLKFSNGLDLVVTGDLKLEDDLLIKGAEPVQCDTLVVESTFGSKEYVFPKREDVYEEMTSWVKANLEAGAHVILAGYAVGKAQELTAFVNEYLQDEPLVNSKTAFVNGVYNEHGHALKFLDAASKEGKEKARDPSVFIFPPHLLNVGSVHALASSYNRRFVSAFATGWSVRGRSGAYSKFFPLSSHASFQELVEFVQGCNPKKVLTVYGHAREFSRILSKDYGFNAQPLTEARQRQLFDCIQG